MESSNQMISYYWIQYSDHNSPKMRNYYDGLIDSHPFKWIQTMKLNALGVILCDYKPITQEEWDVNVKYRIDSPEHRRQAIIDALQDEDVRKVIPITGTSCNPKNMICTAAKEIKSFQITEFHCHTRHVIRTSLVPVSNGDFSICLIYKVPYEQLDVVTGSIDFSNGFLTWDSSNNVTKKIVWKAEAIM